ncbi:hypothetical protein PGT21_002522 [Puccinia graminis f. sp. tritici]|uniref:Uncharacterized protein n=1 Tax=Puccinia graminis f. sp. tritici TaxID=56615 RepID=A0A5B0N1M0_PUCGR|nr:hypothetical protein PGT21_002522 [Puccinia graminis f. sp. tritici]KAA1133692.1 hypothetical protein PGTUg99_031500 [Puccinia graminis f. sp. tritici]
MTCPPARLKLKLSPMRVSARGIGALLGQNWARPNQKSTRQTDPVPPAIDVAEPAQPLGHRGKPYMKILQYVQVAGKYVFHITQSLL